MAGWNSFTSSAVFSLVFVLQFALAVKATGLEEKLEFTIEEGVPRGSLVGRIPKRDGYVYRLNERNRFFTFNSSTGDIQTLLDAAEPLLDRESLDRYGYKRDSVDFVILASASQHSITGPSAYFIAVTVHVVDTNDNAPTFPFPFQNGSIPESARVGSRVILASATDLDEGENGSVKEYKLENGNEDGLFQLARGGGGNGGSEESSEAVLLELVKPIDRETRNLYVLNVSAVDGGNPPLSGFLTVFVSVLDSNDNQPIFDRQQYGVSVSETLPVGASILLVSATDRDSGENARITYSIGNDQENQFRINPDTGVVSSNRAPLRCPEMRINTSIAATTTRMCTFTVEATDHGSPVQKGRAFVNVELFDVNDHAPEITFRYYSPSGSTAGGGNGPEMAAVIEETKPVGTVVAVITVTDPDHGVNGKTNVAIVKGNELGHFRLESSELFSVIRTNATLNGENVDRYNVTIMATDKGIPAKFTFKNMVIYVSDANDQPPAFVQGNYMVRVQENSPIGSYVVSVKAKSGGKKKEEKNAWNSCGIWYDFVNDSTKEGQNLFRLDHKTGLVTVNGFLDYDEWTTEKGGRNFTFKIEAKDACRPSLHSSTTTLTIQLIDVNDQIPRFSKDLYDISIFENATVGTLVLKLEAYDGDDGENGLISYGFANSIDPTHLHYFAVDSFTGRITLSSLLDREETTFYKLPVIAYDHGSTRLEASSMVLIRILDVNDNPPRFLTSEYYTNLHPFDPAGTPLARVSAEDPDEGPNGDITYFFLEPPPVNAIALNQKTGHVYLKTRMTLNGPMNRFDVVLGAADGGGLRALNNATIHVYVNDVTADGNGANGLPKFTKESYQFRVQEDAGENGAMKWIGTVSATDADANVAPVQYRVVDGDPEKIFDIGQYSGELRATSKIDYEQASGYDLTVAALGHAGVAVVNVKIHIDDLNDERPRFMVNETNLLVERGFPVGYPLYTAKALDMDSGPNGLIKYHLKSGEDSKHFFVDESAGSLVLASPAYVLRNDQYQISISASDSGANQLNDSLTCRVQVVDGHGRFGSWFPQKWYDLFVWENTPINTRLVQLNLTKPCNRNGKIDCLFYVENELTDDPLGVFPDGWIYVKNELDFETRTAFQLNVAVKQAVEDRNSNNTKYTISRSMINLYLLDQNDNAPKCSKDVFSFQLPEHCNGVTNIGTVTANDADSGLNGFVHYQLLADADNYSQYFHIGPSTGDVLAVQSLDRERLIQLRGSSILNLVVEAEDHGSPSRKRDRCHVQVQIVDVNDHAPQFALDVYAVSVPEDQEILSEILRISATDMDELENGAIEYSILEGDDPEPRFWINSTTGQLYLQNGLDREYKDSYTLKLMARDHGKPTRLNSTTYAMVFVMDVNDHTPEFIDFSHVIHLSEFTPIGSIIARIQATDLDSGPAGSVRYSIAEGNSGQAFELDPIIGSLILIRPLDYETQRNFTLTIWASDGGTPALRNTSELVINVLDENDNSPVITTPVLVTQILEDAVIGTKVYVVTATDHDTGLNGTVRFRLVDQKPIPVFSIHADTGVISITSKLDPGSTDVYNVLVEATDSCENESLRLSTKRLITVLTTDGAENGFSGLTTKKSIILDMDDQRQVPYQIATLGNGMKFTFSLIDGDKGTFELTPSGELTLKKSLDGSTSLYQLKLAAQPIQSDPVQGNFTGTGTNRLYVDYNVLVCSSRNDPQLEKNRLQFEKNHYEFRASTTAMNGSEIGRVKVLEDGSGSRSGSTAYHVTRVSFFPSTNSTMDPPLVFDVDAHSGLVFSTGMIGQKRFRNVNTVLLEITAVDSVGKGSGCAKCEVIIRIDPGAKKVKFSEYFYQFQVSEDAPVGTTIGLLKTVDIEVAQTIRFAISNGTKVPFQVDASTGAVRTSGILDRETMDTYQIQVHVTDGVTTADASLHVELLDVNDNEPVFDRNGESGVQFKVSEGAQRNTFVGKITALDRDSGANGQVEYRLLQSNPYFQIDTVSGVIRTVESIDREEYDFFFLDVQVADRGNPPKFSNTTVFVKILDVNDHQPILDRSFYEVSVFENATVGTSLLQLTPWDYDTDTKFTFSIVSGNVWAQFNVDDNGTLLVSAPLDRETRSIYHLVITVYDQPPNIAVRYSTNAQITINVLDVNDCAPQFISANWTSQKRGAAQDFIITTVKAIDSDDGQAGLVNYLLDPTSAGTFSLDPVSGDLRLAGDLPNDGCSAVYNLSIWAYDRGEPILSTNQHVSVFVLPNEYDLRQPAFEQKTIEVTVSEDAPVGTTLLLLKLHQEYDEGCEMTVRYWSVENGGDEAYFHVSPTTGLVSIARQLDFERKRLYNLTVAVANLESNESSDWTIVLVRIKDVNDNTPVFLQSPVYLDVVEGTWTTKAISVGLVAAVDADFGANAKLSYSIIQGNTSVFSIDSLSGELKMQGDVDREMMDLYMLTVEVADSGTPRKTAVTSVFINVLDVNDNDPIFDKPSYVSVVLENQAVGTLVLVVSATDADEGKNGIVSYRLESAEKLPFTIGEVSGEIRTKSVLDRELRNAYNFNVIAVDSGSGSTRNSVVHVLVKVDDGNDNTPTFLDAAQDIYVRDLAMNGDILYVVGAEDADEGENARLVYSMAGRDAQYFDITPDTGVIRWRVSSSKRLVSDFSVDVFITDNGAKQRRNASTSLRFFPRSADDFPTFTGPKNRNFTILENQTSLEITIFNARSPKPVPKDRVTYSIASGNFGGAFQLNTLTGKLSTTAALDYEFRSTYELYIAAADNDNPPLVSFTKLVVNLEDCNDNAPVFQETSYTAIILEEEPPPLDVVQVKATDADSGLNGQVRYQLGEDSPLEIRQLFQIDSETGTLVITKALDREKASKYKLTVEAVDGGSPTLSASVPVIVNVADVNDNAPKFTRLFTGSVPEDAPVGTFVTQVTSSDADTTPDNANNTYYFSVNPGEKFAIDWKSGDVTVKEQLDREVDAEYQLKVVAADGAWRVETSLTITVLDVNDNAPVFSRPNYTYIVSSHQSPLTLVGKIEANDSDEKGQNSKISYRLLEKSPFFLVDSQSGEVRLTKSLLENNDYAVTVVAEDAGRPVLSSTAQVFVKVINANDRYQVFPKKSITIAMPADVEKNTRIGIVPTDVRAENTGRILYAMNESSDGLAIDPGSGTIFTTKHLSNAIGTQLRISMTAQDASSSTPLDVMEVILVVTDVNKHQPEFSSSTYSISVTESTLPGTAIFTVSARDRDQGLNGKVTYACARNHSKDHGCDWFDVDEDTGIILLTQALDYELEKQHTLVFAATDGGYEPKTAFANIQISMLDVNDNPPRFVCDRHDCGNLIAHVIENSPVRTPVIRLTCTDADSHPHNLIRYSLQSEGEEDKFLVNEMDGIVTVAGEIDCEAKSMYKLAVHCSNPNSTTPMSSSASLTIFVDGQNEYLPKFEVPNYHFEASSLAGDGTVVGVVKAMDYDCGQDGIVYYCMKAIEGTDYGGRSQSGSLMLNGRSGEIMIKKRMNGETMIHATVFAYNSNLSSSLEIDVTHVVVTFTPTGSTTPILASKTIYGEVLENATTGTAVLKINASSAGRPFYVISDGNIGGRFSVDESGVLRVSGQLDREILDTYRLTLKAYGERNGSAFSTAEIVVTVLDVNDNAPYLTESASVGYVLENDPSGIAIMTLRPTDVDLPPNQGPYTFTLLESPSSHLFHLDGTTGVLRSKTVFDRETVDRYVDFDFDFDYSPSISGVVRMVVLCFNGLCPEEIVYGTIPPVDPDSVGEFNCKSRNNDSGAEVLVRDNCGIMVNRPASSPSNQRLLMTGNDGLHDWINYETVVDFETLEETLIQHSVLVTVRGDRGKFAKSFLEYLNGILTEAQNLGDAKAFVGGSGNRRLTAEMLYVSPQRTLFMEKYQIGLVILDLGKPLPFLDAVALLEAIRGQFSSTDFEITQIFPGFCGVSTRCQNGGTCVELASVDTKIYDFVTEWNTTTSFPKLARSYRCDCPPDFSGVHCERAVDHCASRPCSNGATCVFRKEKSKVECICPAGYTGPTCADDINECEVMGDGATATEGDSPANGMEKEGNDGRLPCLNGGWCENTKGSFKCVCMVGYSGERCEVTAAYCATNPCLNGGKCTANNTGYTCTCGFGYTGKECGIGSQGFEDTSYMEVKNPGDRSESRIEMEFVTIRANSLILYSYVEEDYLAVDVSNGRLRISSSLESSGQGVIESKAPVNDGQWYKIEIMATGKKLTLSLMKCDSGRCTTCPNDDKSCQVDLNVGMERLPWLRGGSIFLGTARDFDQFLTRASQLSAPGFAGCIRNLQIDGIGMDKLEILHQDNVMDRCPRLEQSPCVVNQSNPCGEGEKCQDGWTRPICSCRGGFSSSDCKAGENSASFTGDGYISYQLTESYRRRLLFSQAAPEPRSTSPEDSYRYKRRASSHYPKQWMILEFRTTSTDGLLLSMSSKEGFSLIDISNGTVRFVSRSSGSVPIQITLNEGPFVSDGEWHLVSLALEGNGNEHEVVFRIDNFGKDAKSRESLHPIISADLRGVSLGNVAEPVKIGGNNLKGFNGCMRKFIVNGVLQPLLHGDVTFLDNKIIGEVSDGCDSACSSPPCPNQPSNMGRFNSGTMAVLVFFACMIVSTGVAYVIVRRVKRRKSTGTCSSNERTAFVNGTTTIANIATLSDIVRSKQGDNLNLTSKDNSNGSIKDSGIVLGVSRQTLDSSQISLNNPFDAHGSGNSSALSASTYLHNYLNEQKDEQSEVGTGNLEPENRTFIAGQFVERYDLEDASSIAPSDVDISKHYRDFRHHGFGPIHGDGRPGKMPSRFVPPPPFVDSSVPSLFQSMNGIGARNRKTPGARATIPSVLAMMPESESSDDVMMQRNLRIGTQRETPQLFSKGKPEFSRSLRSRQQRRSGDRGKLRRSAKRRSKRRQQEQENRRNEESESGASSSSSDCTQTVRSSQPTPSRRSTTLVNSVPPRILSRLDKDRDRSSHSTNGEFSDCVSAMAPSEFDLDQVRKPRRFLQPLEDTETDSDFNAVNNNGGLSFCLDQFIPGPRTLFLMSEDDDNASDVQNEREERRQNRSADSSPATTSGLPNHTAGSNQTDGLEAFV